MKLINETNFLSACTLFPTRHGLLIVHHIIIKITVLVYLSDKFFFDMLFLNVYHFGTHWLSSKILINTEI